MDESTGSMIQLYECLWITVIMMIYSSSTDCWARLHDGCISYGWYWSVKYWSPSLLWSLSLSESIISACLSHWTWRSSSSRMMNDLYTFRINYAKRWRRKDAILDCLSCSLYTFRRNYAWNMKYQNDYCTVVFFKLIKSTRHINHTWSCTINYHSRYSNMTSLR